MNKKKSSNSDLLPLSNYLKTSKSLMIEEVILRLPYEFEVPYVDSDHFPVKLKEHVNFVNNAISTSFDLQKSNNLPSRKLFSSWCGEENHMFRNKPDVEVLGLHLDVLCEFWIGNRIYTEHMCHSSLQWYKAIFIYTKVGNNRFFGNEEFNLFIDAIQKSDSQVYLENISLLIFFALKENFKGDKILDSNLFKIWKKELASSPNDAVNSRKVSKFIVDGAESTYATLLHEHTKQSFINRDYFALLESTLLGLPKESIEISEMCLSFSIIYSVTNLTISGDRPLSKLDLLKFSSNLIMISHFIPKINITDLPEKEQLKYNEFLNRILMSKGYITSTKMVVINKAYLIDNGELKIKPQFINTILEAREKFAWDVLRVAPIQIEPKQKEELQKQMNLQLNLQENNKKYITSFGAKSALVLFSKVLDGIENVSNIDKVKRLVDDSFVFSVFKDKTFFLKDHDTLVSKKTLFNFAGQINNQLFDTEYSFIFQLIFKKHAFYASISSDDKNYKIVIIDGAGLDIHNIDVSLDISEFADPTHGSYQAIGSIALSKEAYSEFMQHYIYKIMTISSNDDKKGIFLLEQSEEEDAIFVGFEEKLFFLPKFQYLEDVVFRAQTSNNCVLHNLKNIIKHLFNMSISEYGVFENELLKSTDRMISTLLKSSLKESRQCQDFGKVEINVGSNFFGVWEDIETGALGLRDNLIETNYHIKDEL